MSVEVVVPNVVLLRGPGDDAKRYSAKAAKFCTSAELIEVIMADDETDEKVLKNVLSYGHFSVTEFDGWIFGIEGVSRTLTHQLVRKRLASYAQESMRYTSQGGTYNIVVPKTLAGKFGKVFIPFSLLPLGIKTWIKDNGAGLDYSEESLGIELSLSELADISHQWYESMQAQGVPNEDARFGLLEASKTKIMVAMNTHGLLDFFCERTCRCAQWEIRGVATEMLRLAKSVDSIGMENAGPKCHRTQFCIEPKKKWFNCQYSTHISEVQHLIKRNGKIA
jgi:thymidylate synthase (FAD)